MSYKPDLSLNAMRRLCRRAGAERVGRSATMEIAREAIGHAIHAGRRTVRVKDIKAAYERPIEPKRPCNTRT